MSFMENIGRDEKRLRLGERAFSFYAFKPRKSLLSHTVRYGRYNNPIMAFISAHQVAVFQE